MGHQRNCEFVLRTDSSLVRLALEWSDFDEHVVVQEELSAQTKNEKNRRFSVDRTRKVR